MSDWRSSFERLSRSLLLREPYYGHLLVGTVSRAARHLESAVRLVPGGLQVQLEVDPERWLRCDDDQRLALLQHELVHVILRHPLRAREHTALEVWGMSCDLVVNQLIDATHLPEALRIGDFDDLPRGLTADDYYQRLLPLYEQVQRGGTCDGGAAMAAWLQRHCRCSGGSHASWLDFAELSSGELSILRTNVEALLVSTTQRACRRGWGRLPGAIVTALTALSSPPELPWRRLLRLFASQTGATYIKTTISRPSKRYGTVPGTRVRRRHRLTVAVDTSGSVADEELAQFFSEIWALWRRGTSVRVVEADAQVARSYQYNGVTPTSVAGRGGTSFDPAIQWSNEHRSDGLIYFTDGLAPAPTVPSRCPVLWVVTGDDAGDHLPGRVTKLQTPKGR